MDLIRFTFVKSVQNFAEFYQQRPFLQPPQSISTESFIQS